MIIIQFGIHWKKGLVHIYKTPVKGLIEPFISNSNIKYAVLHLYLCLPLLNDMNF